jgi:hypothetical protein
MAEEQLLPRLHEFGDDDSYALKLGSRNRCRHLITGAEPQFFKCRDSLAHTGPSLHQRGDALKA